MLGNCPLLSRLYGHCEPYTLENWWSAMYCSGGELLSARQYLGGRRFHHERFSSHPDTNGNCFQRICARLHSLPGAGRDAGRPFWPKESTGLRDSHMGYIHFFVRHDRGNFPADRAQCFERPDCASIPIGNFSGAYISHEHPHSHQLVPIKRTSPCQRIGPFRH